MAKNGDLFERSGDRHVRRRRGHHRGTTRIVQHAGRPGGLRTTKQQAVAQRGDAPADQRQVAARTGTHGKDARRCVVGLAPVQSAGAF